MELTNNTDTQHCTLTQMSESTMGLTGSDADDATNVGDHDDMEEEVMGGALLSSSAVLTSEQPSSLT